MKYRLHVSKTIKIIIYIFLIALVIALNAVFAWLSFPSGPKTDVEETGQEQSEHNQINNGIIITIVSFVLESGGLIYFIVQDILSTEKSEIKEKELSDYSNDSLPFVDRAELLQQIVGDVLNKFDKKEFYYEFNIKYGEKNGKSRFGRRLMEEFQQLRSKRKTNYNKISKKTAKRIGNVYFVVYHNDDYRLERDIENLYLIKGKKNIIIVNNCNKNDFWCEKFKNKNVFFVKLNYLSQAEDKLLFGEDKIKELLSKLSNMSEFQNKLSGVDMSALSNRLSQLSDNNIGKLVQILQSDDFNILIETDNLFLDFYLKLKNANYKDAEQQYNNIHIPPTAHPIYSYKLRYEKANLNHFLNNYECAFNDLEILDSELISNHSVLDTVLGRKLHFDIILLQAHIQKHLGDFVRAKDLLLSLSENDRNLNWRRSNFAIDIFRLNELDSSSKEWCDYLNSCHNNMQEFYEGRKGTDKNSNFYFFEAYYPIVAFYKSKFDLHKVGELIKIEDDAIAFYEAHERRLLTNCWFIKAEFLRIAGNLKEAEEYYSLCYQVYLRNGDKDILYLVAITEKYIEVFYNYQMQIVANLNDVLENCINEEGYTFHNQLISKLVEAGFDNDAFAKIKQHFENTINPIP